MRIKSKGKMVFKSRLLGAMRASIAFISLSANAVTVVPSDYMLAFKT